jgi:hypothetical protein
MGYLGASSSYRPLVDVSSGEYLFNTWNGTGWYNVDNYSRSKKPAINDGSAFSMMDVNGDGYTDAVFTSAGSTRIYTQQVADVVPLTTVQSGVECYGLPSTGLGLTKIDSFGISPDTCTLGSSITTLDADGDRMFEVVGGMGLVNLGTNNRSTIFTSGDVVIPVDLNADSYLDYLATNTGKTKAYIAAPPISQVTLSSNVSIMTIQPCAADVTGAATFGIYAKADNLKK